MSENERRVAVSTAMALVLGLGLLCCCVGTGALFFLKAARSSGRVAGAPGLSPMTQRLSKAEFELVKVKAEANGQWTAIVRAYISHPENLKLFNVETVKALFPSDAKLLKYTQKLKALTEDKDVFELGVSVGPVPKSRRDFEFAVKFAIRSEYSETFQGSASSSSTKTKTFKFQFKDFDATKQIHSEDPKKQH